MLYFCFDSNTKIKHETSGWSLVKDHRHIWRTLHQVELFLVTDGDLYLSQRGNKFHLTKGDFLLSEPDVAYGGYSASTAKFHWTHFIYPDGEARFSDSHSSEFCIPQYGKLKMTDSLFVIQILTEQYAAMGIKSNVTDALTTALLRDLSTLTAERREAECKDKRFQPIMDYFNNNPYFNEFKDVRSMAEYFGYSEKYLIYLFKRNTGKSPLQYLTARKMLRAQEMLANTDMTVKGIASALNYDYYYFMRLFRKTTGMTPTQYRKAVIPDWRDYLHAN